MTGCSSELQSASAKRDTCIGIASVYALPVVHARMKVSVWGVCLPMPQILEELFRSATGCVHKARRRENGTVYVLKERRAAELGAREDVLHEVRLLNRVDHPNVIKCYGYFTAEVGDTVRAPLCDCS